MSNINEVKENVSNLKVACVYGSSKKICGRFVEILFPDPWRYASKQVETSQNSSIGLSI